MCRTRQRQGGKRQGSGLDAPDDLTQENCLYLPGETDGVKIHLRSKLRVPDLPRFCYDYVLLDSGNKTHRTLMSEELFHRINPNGELKPVKLSVNTADKDSKLEVLGTPTQPIEMEFYEPNDGKQHKIRYRCLPVIIRNLQFPCLLSTGDLEQLQASVDFKTHTVTMYNKHGPSTYNMVGAPRKPADAYLCEDVTIKPQHEVMVMVTVKGGEEGDEMQFDPSINVILENSVLMCCTVGHLSKKKQMPVRLYNPSNVPVRFRNKARLGEAQTLSSLMNCSVGFVDTFALAENSDLQKARPLTKWSDVKTRSQLYQRLEEDLGFDKKDHSLTVDQRKDIVRVFANHREALALNYDELGHVKGVQFRIPTGDAKPVKSKCRPLPPHLDTALTEQVERWLTQKVISPGDGPWAAPLVPVPKKNGGWRFAVDYRGLNAVTETDARPVANLDDQLAKVRNSPMKKLKYFASLDLSEAYHCIDVAEEDKPKTAMISPKGLHYFNKMSFGLKGAPQAFHQIVQMIEQAMHDRDPELAKTILLYFDDCLIAAETFEELIAKLDLFLQTIQKIGLKVQPRKCLFCVQRVKWLGHVITEGGIQPDPDRVKPLIEWETPCTLGDVRSLHGLLGTMRRFVRGFADKTKNIRKHLKPKDTNVNNKKLKKNKNQPIQWDTESQAELNHLVEILTSAPVLGHPDFSEDAQRFIVTVDTSSHGVGATLSQKQRQEDGKLVERIIAYCSRKLRDGERSYSAYKLELCGLVTALEHFRYFLIGKPFKVRTDHRALQWLMKPRHNQALPALLWRWHQWIAEYDYEIEWVSAAKMKMADALSRKRYKDGDFGTMEVPYPKRDPLWAGDASLEDAQKHDDDDFWINVMKTKFHRTEDGDYDSGIESDDNVDVALLDREHYVCSVDLDYESDEEEFGGEENTNDSEFDLGTCFAVTRSQQQQTMASPEQSLAEGGGPMEVDDQSNSADSAPSTEQSDPAKERYKEFVDQLTAMRIRWDSMKVEEVKEFFPKWDKRRRLQPDEDPNEEDMALEREFWRLTGHGEHVEVYYESINSEMEEGEFTYDTPSNLDVKQSVLNEAAGQEVGYDDNTDGPFHLFLYSKQRKDVGLNFIRDCLDGRERWPENDMEVKRLLKRLYHVIWINREEDVTAGPMPVIPDERNEHTPEVERLQRIGNPEEQKKMRARMHDRQMMVTELCRAHRNGAMIKRTQRVLEIDGRIIVPVVVDLHKKMIQAIHHSQGAFHLGVNKTNTILQKYFWFNSMEEKVAKYLRACRQCQDGKRLTFRLKPELGQTSSYSRERLRTWAMDMIHMPEGHGGKNYILTCLDLATSWIEAWPIRRATAEKVAEVISTEIVPRYGEGLAFVVDQGKEFTAHVVKGAVDRSLSKIHYGTVYNSQSNPVERFHRTLEGVIRCLLIDRKLSFKKWPCVLPDALRTLRSAPDATTKYSPYFRVFGMEPRIQAIEWMNIKPKGGFLFAGPIRPPTTRPPFQRPVDVKEQDVYPRPANTADGAKSATTGSDNSTAVPAIAQPKFVETIKQDEVHLEVTLNDHTRLLQRVPRTKEQEEANDHHKYYRQVFHLPLPENLLHLENAPTVGCVLPQEVAQQSKDQATKEQHERNAARQRKRFPQTGTWYPVVGELLDWKDPIDPDNPNTRKLKNPYQGPYVVLKRDVAGKTVTIKKVNAEKMVMEGKRRTVHVGQVRPTLALEFMTRPRGEDFDPCSLFEEQSSDVYAATSLTEFH